VTITHEFSVGDSDVEEYEENESSQEPEFIKKYLNDLTLKVKEEIKNNQSKKPSCYDKGQFWIEPPNPFFIIHENIQYP